MDELTGMGFSTLSDFTGRQAEALTEAHSVFTGRPPDAAISACFVSLVRFAETGIAIPVWRILRAEALVDRGRVVARGA